MTNANSTDSTTNPPSGTGYNSDDGGGTPPPADDKPKMDDFGYEQPTGSDDKKPDDEPPKDDQKPKDDDKPVEKPATGYGEGDDEPPKDDKKDDQKDPDESGDTKDDQQSPEEKEKQLRSDISEVLKDKEGFNKDLITDFAVKNKMSKEQIEAYVNLVNEETKIAAQENEERVKQVHRNWTKELKDDPDFGGENFVKNVDRVEKVLENHMPNLKKALTERGGLMPPYLMRDLLSLDKKVLNPKNPLVDGEPKTPVKKEGNFLEELYQ